VTRRVCEKKSPNVQPSLFYVNIPTQLIIWKKYLRILRYFCKFQKNAKESDHPKGEYFPTPVTLIARYSIKTAEKVAT
jgi:hypothetical protein